ncbi:hypothetical protein B2J88_22400 [Rhodococcus sp. SRB_17]|uniref:GlxA family transcriptional regulator n=1 Tax=Acidovorax sp. SRB_24 TaxID=1962700 RepID=UPI00145F3BE0|nr:helix-turn-helix domain-containing protein [Acidovorax sp. SRB_24]NMM87081.1 hypothetical protein [Rhodococcus sp. SRB_17]
MTLLIDLMLLDSCMAGALFTTIDTLFTANRIARMRAGSKRNPPVRWRLIDAKGQPVALDPVHLAIYGPVHEENIPQPWPGPRALVIPPLHARSVPHARKIVAGHGGARAWIAARHAAGDLVVATGTGVWLLAGAGILNHCTVSVPWTHEAWFARDFPDVQLSHTAPFTLDQRVLCGTTPSQQVELTCRMLATLGATDLASTLANMLLFDSERQLLMTDMASQGLIAKTGDSVLRKAIEWMRLNIDQPVRMEDIAGAASTSSRTLLRHFTRDLGKTPLEYLTHLRMQRAQMLLEVTLKDVADIAHASGYADVRAFRKVFLRETGTTPSEHRRRRAPRAARKHWRLDEVWEDETSSGASR